MLGGKNIEEGFGIAYRVIQVTHVCYIPTLIVSFIAIVGQNLETPMNIGCVTYAHTILLFLPLSLSSASSGLPAGGIVRVRACRPAAGAPAAVQCRAPAAEVCG